MPSLADVTSGTKFASQFDDEHSLLMFKANGPQLEKDMRSDEIAKPTQRKNHLDDKTRSVQQFISKKAADAQYDIESEARTRSIQPFISKDALAIQESSDRKRSVQPFISTAQYDIESEARIRSIQPFISKEADAAQYDVESEARTRSVQPFISKEALVVQDEAQSSDRKRSIQEFQTNMDIKQHDMQSKDRPRSMLDFIPKRLVSNETQTGDTRSRSGACAPMLSDNVSMDSFDHKYSIPIGYSTGVFTEKGSFRDHVVQFCSNEEWHSARSKLVNIAKVDGSSLVPTRSVFNYQDHYFVCSERADTCLADVIDCSFLMSEDTASAILSQVVHEVYNLLQKGIQYNGVKAANIYITAVKTTKNDITHYRVQLANFAPHLNPAHVESPWSDNQDCVDVGWLGIHILTRRTKAEASSGVTGQTMKGRGPFTIDLKRVTPSGDFLDFLDMCAFGDIRKLLSHKFLRDSNSICLHPYVVNGGYHSVRHR